MGKDSGSHGQRVGYIRVSTVEQNNQRQKELLNASGSLGAAGNPIFKKPVNPAGSIE